MDSEQNRESGAPARSLLAPPTGTIEGIRAFFWNQRELRAGWRLLIFVGLFIATGAAISFFALFLHLPYATATNVTATGLLVQEILLLFAVMATTAILGVLEGRRIGDYGLPANVSPTTRPAMRNTTNSEMARKNKTRAAAAAPTASPENPIAPAISEIKKNINAHRNIGASFFPAFAQDGNSD